MHKVSSNLALAANKDVILFTWRLRVVAVCIIAIFVLFYDSNNSISQSSPCTCEPDKETEQVTVEEQPTGANGWKSQATSRTPQQLERTALAGGMGGGGVPPSMCNQIINASDLDNLWVVSETQLVVENRPLHDETLLFIENCGGTKDIKNTYATISDPNGSTHELVTSSLAIQDSRLIYYQSFNYTEDIEGTYIIHIKSPKGNLDQEIELDKEDVWEDYEDRQFILLDGQTGQSSEYFQPGQSVYIEYSHYSPNESVEMGLYQYRGNYELVSSWRMQMNADGEYREALNIPIDIDQGYYLLVSISQVSYDMLFGMAKVDPEKLLVKSPDIGELPQKQNNYFYRVFTISNNSPNKPQKGQSINSGESSSTSNLNSEIQHNISIARVQTTFEKEAKLFLDDLLARIDEFQLSDLGITQSSMTKVLRQPDAAIRLNALIQEIWSDWQDKIGSNALMIIDPNQVGLSPFRQLVIKMIQGKQGVLVDSQQHALYNYFTRQEDPSVWQNNMDGVIGAINRESFQWQP